MFLSFFLNLVYFTSIYFCSGKWILFRSKIPDLMLLAISNFLGLMISSGLSHAFKVESIHGHKWFDHSADQRWGVVAVLKKLIDWKGQWACFWSCFFTKKVPLKEHKINIHPGISWFSKENECQKPSQRYCKLCKRSHNNTLLNWSLSNYSIR